MRGQERGQRAGEIGEGGCREVKVGKRQTFKGGNSEGIGGVMREEG